MNRLSNLSLRYLAVCYPLLLLSACGQENSRSTESPGEASLARRASYVGRGQCIECHRQEYDLWTGSHHDLAMDSATELTVLGDFSGVTLSNYGITSRFYRQDGRFFVATEGPDGKIHDYEVKYTFGFTPLQQYLVEFPGGKLQTLPLCWDTRPLDQGGQQWFHIYPHERIAPNDELFWAGLAQNWNYVCADCHSTDLRKNYDVDSAAFRTTWSEIDVSCEACHGPGSEHVAWGRKVASGWKPGPGDLKGLVVQLRDPGQGTWVFDPGARTARRTVPVRPMTQVEICAPCHSRRSRIKEEYDHRSPYMETFVPQLLDERMYYADGQILDEVYVYASFRQSKMYHKGVVCSDCHEPHSARVYSPGNTLCYRCHLQESYGTKAHHFHKADSTGGSCTACHMPSRTYMVVDPRLDHSIRNPRPDLTVHFGFPNACNTCHKDRSAKWAADSVARWYPAPSGRPAHYGEVLHAGRTGAPGAEAELEQLVAEKTQPAIVRATALSLLGRYGGPGASNAINLGLLDSDPIVRYGAVKGLEGLPLDRRFAVGRETLKDPVLGVRLEAVRVLSPVSRLGLSAADNALLDEHVREFEVSARVNGDRPPSWVLLGNVYTGRGDPTRAEAAYKRAIALDSLSPLGRVNLADLYRTLKRDTDGERILRRGIELNQNAADLHYALGLLLVRNGKSQEGLAAIERSVQLSPENARYSYVYAVGLHGNGNPKRAIQVLEGIVRREPYDREALFALVEYYRETGSPRKALPHVETLIHLSPGDPGLIKMYQDLRR